MLTVKQQTLRTARRRLKLSMEDVGLRMDPPVSSNMVSKYEMGKTKLTNWAKFRLYQMMDILYLEAQRQAPKNKNIDPAQYTPEFLCPDLN